MPNNNYTTGFNWFYAFVAICFISMLYISIRFFKGSDYSAVGIADAQSYKINSEKPALVKQIPVIAGQVVKVGDLLVELSNSQLDIDIERISNRIVLLKMEQNSRVNLQQSQVAYVEAEEGVSLEEINTKIAEVKSEFELNSELTKALSTTTDTAAWSTSTNPSVVKLQALAKQKGKQEDAMRIKKADIRQRAAVDQQQLQNQIRLFEQELALLLEEKKNLSRYAAADGVVQNIYVKSGELVPSFTPLLSINPLMPTVVVGYLTERNVRAFTIGDSVKVSSISNQEVIIAGKVIGYGSIHELPMILQKSTAVKAFGRELFINIASPNHFATGEKLLIR